MATKAEQYAQEVEITLIPRRDQVQLWAAELRRLAPMEAERENLKQSLAAANAMHHDEQLHSAQISKGLDKALARVKELEEVLRLALPHLESAQDCGPEGEGWQSDELMALIAKGEELLGETK